MNEMKCDDVESGMIDYLDNKLGEKERGAIEAHIAKCERCLDAFNATQKLLGAISGEDMENPDESLRINFYSMLKKEAASSPSSGRMKWNILRIAAGAALLIAGSMAGALITNSLKNTESRKDLAQLKTEVEQLKRTAMFTMLKEESSSYRIQAVNYADEIQHPDVKVIAVLLNTLNHDKNVNVRMAAAYALSKFADQKAVSDSLVESLSTQVDPILQVTLINILVERNEKGAIRPMQKIIDDSGTLKEVKAVAEKGIKILL